MNKKRFYRPFPSAVAGVFACVVFSVYLSWGENQDDPVREGKTGEADMTVSYNCIGTVEAVHKVDVVPRISGNIVEKDFKAGDFVKKGQKLFEIENVRYKLLVQACEARIKGIEADLAYARDSYERQSKLSGEGTAAGDSAEKTLSVVKGLEARMMAAEAELALARNDLKYTLIEAPIDGCISRENFSAGSYVAPSDEPLATIVSVNPVYVCFPVGEKDFISLFGKRENMKDQFDVRIVLAEGRTYGKKGSLAMTDSMIQPGTGTIAVWAEFDNPDHLLIPGAIVRVLIYRTEKK